MNAFNTFWETISEQGIQPALPTKQYKSIVLTNQISITAALCCIPFIILYYLLSLDSLFAVAYISLFLFLVCLLLNRFGEHRRINYQASKVLMMLVVNAHIFFTASCLGRESGFHLMYFSSLLGVVLYYNFHQRLPFLIVGLSLPLACLVALEFTGYSLFLIPSLEARQQHNIYLAVMIVNIIVSLLIAFYFNTLNARHRQTLASVRQELETVFDNSYDAIILIDSRTDKILECNRKAVKLFEAESKAALIGIPSKRFQKVPFTLQENQGLLQSLQHKGTWVEERRLVSLRGREFWGDIGITLLPQEDKVLYLVRITDITEKQAAKEQLQKSESALREAQRLARMGNFEFNLQTGKGVVSEEVYRIFGMPPHKEISLTQFVQWFASHHTSVLQETIGQASPRKKGFEVEYEATRPDGETPLYIQSFGEVLFDAEGRPSRIVGTTQDITERKLREIELIKAKAQAEQASIAKEQFLSTMSHEIRTPINAILGLSHFLLEDSPRPDQAENLKVLHFSAENLLMLINDILDLNKIEAGKIAFEAIEFNLSELVQRIQRPLSYLAYEKNLAFSCYVDPAIPPVLVGDPVRLGQVINNLLSNAIKFTEEGSVRVEAQLKQLEGSYAEIGFAITDTGIGIAEDKLEYVFETFTQASSDTTRKYGGTGLGLTITKRLLELQNSPISVKSKLGEGSGFYFTLWFRKSEAQALNLYPASAMPDSESQPLRGRKILLVEDNEINRLVAAKIFQKWGIVLDEVTNGMEAVERVQQTTYDIVLMDLQMPHMDGYETTQLIRGLEGSYFSQLPIIAITASVMPDVQEKTRSSGMNDCVTKPFQPEELYGKMLRLLGEMPAPELSSGVLPINNTQIPIPETGSTSEPSLNYGKLQELTAGNEEFQHLLTRSYVNLFRQLKDDYRSALLSRNPEQLRFILNYIEPPFSFLEVTRLKDEILEGSRMLERDNPVEKTLQRSVDHVGVCCDQLAGMLEERLQPGQPVVAG